LVGVPARDLTHRFVRPEKLHQIPPGMTQDRDGVGLHVGAALDRVREWAALEIRRAEREEEFFLFRFGAELETWCGGQIADGGSRRQSVNLPAGTAGFRTIPGNLNIFDEKLALDWCQTNLPDAIRIEKSLSKTALKSYVEATGDLPGVDLRTSATRFHIR